MLQRTWWCRHMLGVSDFIFIGHIPRSWIAEPCSSSIYNSLRSLMLFSIGLNQFTFLSIMYRCSLFSISLSALIISCLFDNRHSSRCEVIDHYGFCLHFPDNWLYWVTFYVSVMHLCYFFREISVQFLSPFLKWVVCFGSRLYEFLIHFRG